MRFLLTGAQECGSAQLNGWESLGGYISGSQPRNGELGSLFGLISLLGKERKTREVLCIAVHNDSNAAVTVNELWVDHEVAKSHAKFEVGLELPSEDERGNKYFSSVRSASELPFGVDFYEVDSSNHASVAGTSIPAGGYLAIWVKRTIQRDSDITDPDLTSERALLSLIVDFN